ncbi:MAG: ABC transporter permease subunit [Planctomycetota bacterium]
MSVKLPLLSAIIRKELKEAIREKQLKIVLVVGILAQILISFQFFSLESSDKIKQTEYPSAVSPPDKSGGLQPRIPGSPTGGSSSNSLPLKLPEYRQSDAPGSVTPPETKQPDKHAIDSGANKSEKKAPAISLLIIMMSWCYSLLLGALSAINLSLESFVGEKERQTLEVLLASPATDYDLFWGKVMSCGFISALLGLSLGLINTAVVIIFSPVLGMIVPWHLLGQVILCSLPIFLAIVVTFVALGVIISSRASTIKGAGQLFGAILLPLIFIPSILGIWILPKYEKELTELGAIIRYIPLSITVLVVFLILALINWFLLSIAIATFHREKILTRV